jgi:hypothetical protein
MEIAVQGWRASAADWDAVRSVPVEQLPALSEQQREVARKLGVPEEDYARSALAGQRTQETLLHKAEALAGFLQKLVEKNHFDVSISRIMLDVVEHRFVIELTVNGSSKIFRVDESIVDDYFDSGSQEAEANLARVFERALLGAIA